MVKLMRPIFISGIGRHRAAVAAYDEVRNTPCKRKSMALQATKIASTASSDRLIMTSPTQDPEGEGDRRNSFTRGCSSTSVLSTFSGSRPSRASMTWLTQ